jgi:hypothetical protein
MATLRSFCYNPLPIEIPNTESIGSMSVATGTINPSFYTNVNLQWWNGPDEDLGYIIAYVDPSGNRPNAPERTFSTNYVCNIGFFRSAAKTDQSFVDLVQIISASTSITTTSQCTSYLTTNGYWTSYVSFITSGLILNYDISNSSSYPGSGTTITDLQANSNATIFNSPIYISSGGSYLIFNGSNQYFRTNTALGSKLNPVNSSTIISIFVWVYPMDDGVIVSEIGSTTPNSGWHDSQIEMVGGTLRFSVWSNNPGFASSISTPLNNWYYVGFTYDGTNLRGYVNGSLAVTSGTISRSTPGANLYYAIAHNDATNLGDGTFANMRFGGMQVYNTALSGPNVLTNYNATKSRFGL